MMEHIEQRLGNYRLNRLLGTGAFADIYLSTHIYLNSHVAIKVLHSPFDTHALKGFLTEARLLINLVHPHRSIMIRRPERSHIGPNLNLPVRASSSAPVDEICHCNDKHEQPAIDGEVVAEKTRALSNASY